MEGHEAVQISILRPILIQTINFISKNGTKLVQLLARVHGDTQQWRRGRHPRAPPRPRPRPRAPCLRRR